MNSSKPKGIIEVAGLKIEHLPRNMVKIYHENSEPEIVSWDTFKHLYLLTVAEAH